MTEFLRIEEGKNGEFAVYDDSAPKSEDFTTALSPTVLKAAPTPNATSPNSASRSCG
jgi:hypothetical protein